MVMEPELQARLDRMEKMISDNNAMLKRTRQAQKNAFYMRIAYWLLIIILGIVSLSFISPYLTQLGAAYGVGTTTPAGQ
jgi:hypothetical protein